MVINDSIQGCKNVVCVQGNQLKDLYTAKGNLSLVQELKHTHDTDKLALGVSVWIDLHGWLMGAIVWVGSTSINMMFAYMVLLTCKWNCQSQFQCGL